MQTWAVTCYIVGALAEFGGLALIGGEIRRSRRALREWADANPKNNDSGSWSQILLLNKVVPELLGSTRRHVTAAALVALGIVAGLLGNLASLPSA